MFSIDMFVKYADLFYYICVSMGVIVNLTMSFLHGRSIDRLETVSYTHLSSVLPRACSDSRRI